MNLFVHPELLFSGAQYSRCWLLGKKQKHFVLSTYYKKMNNIVNIRIDLTSEELQANRTKPGFLEKDSN